MRIAVLGATSGIGRALIARLCDDHHAVVAVGRSAARLDDTIDARAERRVADLDRVDTARAALSDAERVVSAAHARHADAVLAALPQGCARVVLIGSTRRFTAFPDPAADAVRRGEAALAASGRTGVMLHPTMTYGGPGDRNIRRLLALLRRWPSWLPALVPVPAGGRTLVQPVFAGDVVDAIAAALMRAEAPGAPIIVAGPEPVSYAQLLRICAGAVQRNVTIVPMPLWLLFGAARAAAWASLKLPFTADEIRRVTENKNFSIDEMRRRLGIVPMPLEEGLRRRHYRDET